MRNLIRKPLPWMVVSECAIVAALAIVAWHMIANPPAPQAGQQLAAPTTESRESATPGPATIAVPPETPAKSLLPGLNLDSSFWRQRLRELNRGESSFEQLEWRIVQSATSAARRYVKSVVVPAIERAEHVGA